MELIGGIIMVIVYFCFYCFAIFCFQYFICHIIKSKYRKKNELSKKNTVILSIAEILLLCGLLSTLFLMGEKDYFFNIFHHYTLVVSSLLFIICTIARFFTKESPNIINKTIMFLAEFSFLTSAISLILTIVAMIRSTSVSYFIGN